MTQSPDTQAGHAHYRGGDFQRAAQAFVRAINKRVKSGQPPLVSDLNYAAAAVYALQDFKSAATFLRHAVDLDPDNIDLHRNLGTIQMRLGLFDRAVHHLDRCLRTNPDDWIALDALAYCHHGLERADEAIACGERSLTLKDQLACGADNRAALHKLAPQPWQLNELAAPPFDHRCAHRNIIAYSLWGDKRQYLEGALANARVAPVVFPAWVCRFYCDSTVPEKILDQLRQAGSQVVMMPPAQGAYYGLFWRFLAADDPQVDRYLIRDVDSPLTHEERLVVDQWLASGELFHIIRDWYTHTELILAGLWGGVQGALPPLKTALDQFYRQTDKERTMDQQFLRLCIWPLIKDRHLAHDSLFAFGRAVSWDKTDGPLVGSHVGQNWTAYNKIHTRQGRPPEKAD